MSILNIMIVYLEIPPEKFVELKKRYPISRNENNGRLYFDTQIPYFGMFMNTGMPFQLQEYVVGKACWDDVMSFNKPQLYLLIFYYYIIFIYGLIERERKKEKERKA